MVGEAALCRGILFSILQKISKITAKKACCHEFISKLPNGYNTVIGYIAKPKLEDFMNIPEDADEEIPFN